MKKVIKEISQIDNMADLNAVIQAVKDQQSILRNRLARQAKASFAVGDNVSFNGRRGRMSGEILKIKIKNKREIYLGDIIINLTKIKNKKDLIKFQNEFNKLWIHGLVHLFGHEHKKDSAFSAMSKIERRYLEYIN